MLERTMEEPSNDLGDRIADNPRVVPIVMTAAACLALFIMLGFVAMIKLAEKGIYWF